jgi:hypothetical protein
LCCCRRAASVAALQPPCRPAAEHDVRSPHLQIEWHTFAWSLGVGVPLFAWVCYLWRDRLASSLVRRVVASLLLATACAPSGLGVLGPVAVDSAVFDSLLVITDPTLLLGASWLIFPTTLAILGIWNAGLWVLKRPKNHAT